MENNNNIVVVGDGYVGKTSILNAIKDNNFEEQIPNVYNDFEYTEVVNGKECRLRFIDTAGQEEYDMLRKLSYREVRIVILFIFPKSTKYFQELNQIYENPTTVNS
ncbi:Ras and/or Miro domain containing protein [Asbolus verrucosus]|uniref:Ras and/or Miro domain containing protein n=1 Tax=Asbolus verrucosus TaxID=1661398 RepID=A0A482VBH7_ASBVE|nr:Ras and/or Miro domain containing protein [Asbolus verrucosus]